MEKRSLFTALVICATLLAQAQVTFIGNRHEVFEEEPARNTGLNRIYVLHDTQGVGMTYTATTENPVTWYEYGEQGGAFAEPISGVLTDGNVTTLSQLIPNRGYIIEEGTTRYYMWITDHSLYPLTLEDISADSDGDCSTVTIHVQGQGPDIAYYTITGVKRTLSRDMRLQYYNLEWDDTTHWQQKEVLELEESFKPTIVMPAPFCSTTFTLAGDRFMDFWDETVSVESGTYTPAAVDVRAIATQEERDNDNEKSSGMEGALGGSAPVTITFEAFCTDEAIHHEWQMATDPEFNDIQLRLNQDVVEQTFDNAGTTYWRFIGSNANGSCEAYSETFTVDIGDSELNCPNVFTPGTSEGVNDVWKVSYRSIVDFHCWIFNRWGNKIIEFTDPSQGWDGTYHGKLVGPGVYYYVINARGSDGRSYKLSGDINIIRYKNHGSSSSNPVNTDDPFDDPDGDE